MNRYNPTLLLSLLLSPALAATGCGNAGSETAADQGTEPSDLRTTQQVRDALVAHGTREAKKIQVFTKSGTVTLRGRVGTALERATLEAEADKLAGLNDLDSRLELERVE